MTIFSTGVGATLGLALQFYSNGVRKLPLWRQPWLHVSFIIGGAYAGHCERAKRAVTSSTKQNKTQNELKLTFFHSIYFAPSSLGTGYPAIEQKQRDDVNMIRR